MLFFAISLEKGWFSDKSAYSKEMSKKSSDLVSFYWWFTGQKCTVLNGTGKLVNLALFGPQKEAN